MQSEERVVYSASNRTNDGSKFVGAHCSILFFLVTSTACVKERIPELFYLIKNPREGGLFIKTKKVFFQYK